MCSCAPILINVLALSTAAPFQPHIVSTHHSSVSRMRRTTAHASLCLCREADSSVSAWDQVVSSCTGGISSLQRLWPNGRVGSQWADPKNPLGRFVYSSYTQADYAELFATYMYIDPTEWWVSRDYGKYNVSEANPKRKDAFPDAKQIWFRKVSNASSVQYQSSHGPLQPELDISPSIVLAGKETMVTSEPFSNSSQQACQTSCSPPIRTRRKII